VVKQTKKSANRRSVATAGNGDVRAQLGVIMQDLRGLGRRLGHATTEQLHTLGDRARAVGDDVGDLVRERPLRALLIAAGFGALFSMICRRR
jgi:ElaB/YqjD/DUF883 family membrane-anchored ribosome-binding protein